MNKWIIRGLTLACASLLWAQMPETFQYCGNVTDDTNRLNATVSMRLRIYDAELDGALLYTDQESIEIKDGHYTMLIGDEPESGTLTNVLSHAPLFLEVTIGDQAPLDRQELVCIPFALDAGDPLAVSREVIDPRWIKNIYENGDVTMSDRTSGLIWLYHTNPSDMMDWIDAIRYCWQLTYAGYTEWRLPLGKELWPKLHANKYVTNVGFDGPDGSYYWAGTILEQTSSSAWYADMDDGNSQGGCEGYDDYVLPVHGGTPYQPTY